MIAEDEEGVAAVHVQPEMAAGPSAAGPLVLGALGVVAVMILGAWVWWRGRERAAMDPAGAAFERLSRDLRLRKDQRAGVKDLAVFVRGAVPVALLVSPAAMARAKRAAEECAGGR